MELSKIRAQVKTWNSLVPYLRKISPWLLTINAIVWVWIGMQRSELRLSRSDFLSGYTLAGACSLMFLLQVRKRLLVLPLGRVAYWLRFHQYLGVFSLAVFFLHAGWPIHGWMECLLAFCFLFISSSGLITWYLNRTTPRKLSIVERDRILEDIPRLRQSVAERAFAVAVSSASKSESSALAEHYGQHLVPFFQGGRSIAYALFPTGRLRRQHLSNLERLDRYLSHEGRQARNQMSALVQSKDDLDFQYALQNRLRLWQMVHVLLIWLFLLLAGLHIILAHRFHGN